MKNLITIGSKIGFRQRNNRFKWNEIVSMENDIFTIRVKQSKHYANHFQMEYSKISIAIKEKNIKIICNTKLY